MSEHGQKEMLTKRGKRSVDKVHPGKEVVSGLLERGDHVIMACRRTDACESARLDLISRHPDASSRCHCMQLDLEDFNSIRNFAASAPHHVAPNSKFSLLINNAGVMGVSSEPSPDGHDRHFLVNHLGTYLLTRLLLPHIAPSGRIVTVGSEAHRRGNLALSDQFASQSHLVLQGPHPTNWYAQYARSKLGNSLMTAELSRQLQERDSSITAACVSPGRVATDIFRNLTGFIGVAVGVLASTVFQTPEQGASGVLRTATAPELGRHIPYLHLGKEAVPSKLAQDPKLARQLWQLSNHAVGISQEEEQSLWPKH